MVLICRCGQKLNTPGAVPGRVGKCPRCGSLLKIAEESPQAPEPPSKVEAARPGGTYRRSRAKGRSPGSKAVWADGLATVPTSSERSISGSFNYPFRNASGLGLLAMIPPLLWFGSVPLFALGPMIASGSAVSLLGMILLLPQLVILFFALGHVLLFLGDVILTSCLGAVNLPRQATWSPSEIAGGWGRWVWALVAGGALGGTPALIYWVQCGDVDWFDQVVLIDLILPGLAYAQMALVVALIHDSPWSAANPILMVRAIRNAGWAYFWPCLVSGLCLVVVVGLLKGCLEIGNPFGQALAFWAWWVVALYLAMVALRWLGLFCFRTKVVDVERKQRR